MVKEEFDLDEGMELWHEKLQYQVRPPSGSGKESEAKVQEVMGDHAKSERSTH